MARDEPQVNLRMPATLKQRLDEAALQSKRSLTAEINARLEASIDGVNDALVLDQARQIWMLRGQLAVMGVNLFSAANELQKAGFKNEKRLQEFRDAAETTSDHARYFLSMPNEKVREERIRLGFHPDGEHIIPD